MNIPNTSRMMALAITFAVTSSVLAAHVVTAQLSPVNRHRSGDNTTSGSDNDDDNYGYCGDYIINEDEGEECDEGISSTPGSLCVDCKIIDPAMFCGNWTTEMDFGEECDNGDDENGKPWSDCSEDCRHKIREVCGDGTTTGDEGCDDGNGDNSDGCTNDCKKAKCGDGYIQPSHDEECDAGWKNGQAVSECTEDCKIRPICGNGTIEGDEECDDNNDNNDDECTAQCKRSACGDGYVRSDTEECDDGNNNGERYSECSTECRKKPVCGNGMVEGTEECDKGDANGTADAECSKNCKHVERPNPTDDDGTVGVPPNTETTTSTPSTTQTSDDDDGVVQQVRPAAQENIRIDELRRKREEIEERLKAQKQLDREKAAKAKEANIEHEEEVVTAETAEAPESELLCYDTAGVLTDDRQLCDTDQGQFLTTESVDDETAQVALLKKFKGDNVAESHRADLISTMQSARVRLNTLLASDNHEDDVTKYLGESIAWLDRGITYFSEGPKSSEEVQQMVLPVKQLLVQAKDLIQQEKALPAERVEIAPIVVKTERLLLKFRESFVALARGGVELDQDALTAYVDAAGQFVEIRSACAANAMECGRLNSVLELLKTVQGPIQKAFGENPEIYEAVQAKFDQDS